MTKFKLKKETCKFGLGVKWHYRDFIIEDTRHEDSPYPLWKVLTPNGREIYKMGNGTRKEMMQWVDDYYTEMNDYVINDCK